MPSVGIDISDTSVKFLELHDGQFGKTIGRYGTKEIPEGVVVDGGIKNEEKLVLILTEIKKQHHLHFIRASLPEEKAFLFTMFAPHSASLREVHNLVEFRLEENVPLPPRDTVFDYDVVPSGEQRRGKEAEISVVVFARKTIEEYTNVFQAAGLVPLSLELEAQAIARSLIKKGDLGTYLIVDFGKLRTGLAIVSRGLLAFTSTLDVVGDTITDIIVKHFSVTKEEAERIKNESDFIKNKEDEALVGKLMETISSLKNEIERHHQYWNTKKDAKGGPVPPIEKIVLCGGSSNLVGLRELLSGSLNIPVEQGNVWSNTFSFNDVIPEIDRATSLGYATAVGLALRSET